MTVHTMGPGSMALIIDDTDLSVSEMNMTEIKLLIRRIFEEKGCLTGGEVEIEIEVYPGKGSLMIFAGLKNLQRHCEIYIFPSIEDVFSAVSVFTGTTSVCSSLIFHEGRYYLVLMGDRGAVIQAGMHISEFGDRTDPELKAFLFEHSPPVISVKAIETLARWFPPDIKPLRG